METLIVICLLLIIALLLQDKVVIKGQKENPENEAKNIKLPEIMGLPRTIGRQGMPNTAFEGQFPDSEKISDNFDHEIEQERFDVQNPQEEPEEIVNTPDFEEEEEEWRLEREPEDEDSFATGVTFEELTTVGMLLGHEGARPSLERKAVAIVQKIQGTELFDLMENSLGDVSKKIADLLDRNVPDQKDDSGSSNMRKTDRTNFNIEDFVQ